MNAEPADAPNAAIALRFHSERQPKICGQCGAVLPPELVLTDEQTEALKEQRRWAQELAGKFGSTALGVSPSCEDHASAVWCYSALTIGTTPPDHAQQRTRPSRSGRKPGPRGPSRSAAMAAF